MFIQTEETSDPARLIFLPGREVLAEGTLDLESKEQAASSPLARKLFEIPGVTGVSFATDRIVVTRSDRNWQHFKPAILGVIMEHFMSGAPVALTQGAAARISSPGTDGELAAADEIRAALRQVIDPELGYNIVDLGLIYEVAVAEGGVATVTMTTTTPGCPATNYLKTGAGEAASSVDGVEFVDVRLTYEPRWTPEMMTPEAKAHLGIDDGGGW
ncbi:MAG: NifU N-terminal domain-containing protein [Pseudomonadota bacterium]|nr:NifU N-terminal domain-containing protein [Pseudomonadota bacterium]